jgi:LysM repeat protein
MIVLALLVFCFIALVIVSAVTLLTGDTLALGRGIIFESPSPRPGPSPTIAPLAAVTPGPAELLPFRSVALGLTLDYPSGWRKKETPLRVIFAPTTAGLEPGQSVEPALWAGISSDNSIDPAAVLANILADFPANTKLGQQSIATSAGTAWTLTDLNFSDGDSGQSGRARVAVTSHNDVGYYVVGLAPGEKWPAVEPVFQVVLASLGFTEEAVIRPTDATMPPTPTPSPTPRIYIVQPGDTLGGIALQFDVTIEAIVTRNGLEDPRMIRSGQKLIIPNKKKK